MRRLLSAVLVLGLMLCCFALTAAPQTAGFTAPALGDFRIAGTAVNALSGSPLARVRVTIQDAQNPQRLEWTITSDEGRFEFNRLAAGKFAMQGVKRGFIPSNYDQHGQFSTAIVTGAGLDTEHLVLQLAPLASLSGKVLNEAGEPVRKATVSLYAEDRRVGIGRIQKIRQERTDDQGSYEFAPLDAATYFIAVAAAPWYAVHPTGLRQPEAARTIDQSLDVAYPITYYGDAVDPDDASPILIRGGDHVEADIHLSPVPALHLVFHVPDKQQGFSLPMLQKPSFDGLEYVPASGDGMTSPDVFEMVGVPAGRYTVRMPFSRPGEPPQSSEIEMDLTTDGQELDASKGEVDSDVKASVKLLGEAGLPRQLFIVLRNSKLRVVAYQQPDKNGEFEVSALTPGRYEVLVQAPGKAYSVLRISNQSRETPGHFLDVTAGGPLTISLTLVGSVTRVEGIAKRNGVAAAGAMVVLVPESPEANRELFRRDQSDLDGSFSLQNVISGRYTVCAIEDGWDLDWAKPAVIAHYCEHGRPVVIGEQKESSVRLQDAVEVQPK